jgi:hypothetical protein
MTAVSRPLFVRMILIIFDEAVFNYIYPLEIRKSDKMLKDKHTVGLLGVPFLTIKAVKIIFCVIEMDFVFLLDYR